MKFAVVLFAAFVAFATVNSHTLPDFGKGPLHEDIQYFLDLIPMDQVMAVVLEYAAEDAEFQKLINYCKTSDFKLMIKEIEAIPEFHDFADYLQKNGVYIYSELNKLNKVLDLPPFHQFSSTQKITGGLKGLFEDVKALVSYDKFIHGYVYKMRTSSTFRSFVAELKSKGNQQFVNTLYKNQKFLNFRAMLVRGGLDITLLEDVIYTVLGIEFPSFDKFKVETFASSELTKDLQDFLNLVDKKKIMNIILSYLEDDEVQRALAVVHSEDFHALVRKVEAMHEYQDLVRYLEDAGFDMAGLINKIHKLFGMENYVPPYLIETFANLGGLKGLVNDVIAALPVDKLEALYKEKLRTSAAFKNFIDKLHSQDFQNIVSTVYKTPVFLEMRQKVIKDGVDLTPFRDFIEKFLGIPLPRVDSRAIIFASSELTKDLQDFLNLVDKKKIMNIVLSYLADDEVQRALAVMHSEDFHVLVRKVEAMREYQDLVRYLEDAGFDMTSLLNKIHKLFGMEDYVPPHSMETYANLGGLKGLVNDVIAALPVDKLEALYKEKLRTSAAFKNFIDKLHSQDFQNIVSTVYKTPVFLEMRQKVIKDGVDLTPFRDFIEKFLGIPLPRVDSRAIIFASSELTKDLQDFLNLVDKKKIMNIILSYLEDDEVQRALAVVHSEDFHALVRKVEAMHEYQDLVRYLEDAGFDMAGLINKIHKLFGMEDYVPPYLIETFANLGGLKGLVNDVIAALPVDKLEALYKEKLRTSAAFKNFIDKLHSQDFQNIVSTVYKTPVFLEMRQKVIKDGVDLTPFRDFIEKFLGIPLPRVDSRAIIFASSELTKDLQDFLNLVDKKKIMNIVLSYLADDEVQRALAVMHSEDFHVLVRKVEAMREYQDLVRYLEDAGFDMTSLLNKIHKLFGMEDYVPPHSMETYANLGGLKGLVNDVIAALPVDKLEALYKEKLRTSAAFKNFIDKLHSQDFQNIVSTVYKTPVFLEMRQKVIKDGVDLTPFRDFIEKFLGIPLPRVDSRAIIFASSELTKDLQDFLNLVDKKKIMNIVLSYMEDDEVQRALAVVHSEDFHALVRKVEAMREYQDLVRYLEDAGFDMAGLINKIHKLFGMEDYVPPYLMETFANLGGLKGLVNDVIAALPVDKLEALYKEKLRTSAAFKNFIDKLHSQDFQNIVSTVYKTPVFLEMRQKVIKDGVDLTPFRDFIEKFLGIPLPRVDSRAIIFASSELTKDLQDFLNLVDKKKIMNIVLSYMEDDEVQRALAVVHSEDFHALVRKVEAMHEYQDLVRYLEDAGFDMAGLINKIHKLFGMEDYVPPYLMETFANLGGLKGLVNDVIAALPVDKLEALYKEKLRTSAAFKNFIDKLHSQDFQNIVSTVYKTPVFLEMRRKVIKDGVDLTPFRDFIEKFLGIPLPRVDSLLFRLLRLEGAFSQ
ncbi:hypothetical protein K0M31_010194 [Melipona bicolor]|uniref:Protein G12 n=1 Tax=Melipona bicolor TaxID=60889 RepID=A0AA40FLI1_9HYME|nr:hypothetical protein K0M31_010194 [Melipona bicolor]